MVLEPLYFLTEKWRQYAQVNEWTRCSSHGPMHCIWPTPPLCLPGSRFGGAGGAVQGGARGTTEEQFQEDGEESAITNDQELND